MAAELPGGQRDPGEQAVPSGVGEADLLLGGDPQPVVDGLRLLGGPGRDRALQLGGVLPAGAEQPAGDRVGEPPGAAPGRPGGPLRLRAQVGARARAGVQARVQAADEAAGGRDLRVGRRGGARHHGRQQRTQLAGPHPPQERRADHQDGRGRLLLPARAAAPPGARPVHRYVLQPTVAVRGERDGGRRGDVQAVGEFADQPVELGGVAARQRHGRGLRRCGPVVGPDDQPGHQQGACGDRADRPADGVPGSGVGRARCAEPAGDAPGEQHHRGGGGQHGGGQRPAPDP